MQRTISKPATVDVIIPTYNRAHFLERAIRSVLNQSFQDFQLYVIDDGSTDETPHVLQKYSAHPKITCLAQPNLGVSAARNRAVEAGQSEWVAFLDSDDEWLPQKLQRQVDFLEKRLELEFVHSEEIWVRNGTRVNPKLKHSKSAPDLRGRSLEHCLISPSTVLLRRDLFRKYGGFDEALVVCEDFDLWNKILAFEEVGFISEPLTKKHGGHEDQLSMKFVAMDYWRIRSLLNLSTLEGLGPEQRSLILEVVHLKAPQLLSGYWKHQNIELYKEVLTLLEKNGIRL